MQSTIIPSSQHPNNYNNNHHHHHNNNHHQLTQSIQPKLVQQISLPPSTIDNKIYHCTHCQQLFIKLKAFKKHQCIYHLSSSSSSSSSSKNNSEHVANKEQQQVTSKNEPVQKTNENLVSITNSSTRMSSSISNQIKQSIKTTAANVNKQQPLGNTASSFLNDQNLLKHPLVIKTLLETYKVSSLSELNSLNNNSNSKNNHDEENKSNVNEFNLIKNFYMCSTCGYRGNTVRGVKQHGKSHLQEKEHFGIISATEQKPLLVYYSLNDGGGELLQSNGGANKKMFITSLKVLSHDLLVKAIVNKGDDNIKDSSMTNKISEKSSSGSELDLSLNIGHQMQQPVSKKARLLDAHHQKMQQDSLELNLKNGDDDFSSSSAKSQTYCFKCNIQFQHVSNYLAHKTNYCIDN
jgi:hypothetical protein